MDVDLGAHLVSVWFFFHHSDIPSVQSGPSFPLMCRGVGSGPMDLQQLWSQEHQAVCNLSFDHGGDFLTYLLRPLSPFLWSVVTPVVLTEHKSALSITTVQLLNITSNVNQSFCSEIQTLQL